MDRVYPDGSIAVSDLNLQVSHHLKLAGLDTYSHRFLSASRLAPIERPGHDLVLRYVSTPTRKLFSALRNGQKRRGHWNEIVSVKSDRYI